MIKHIPVMAEETIQYLAPQKNENFIDATCGFGGHTKQILEKTSPEGKLLAIDQDLVAINQARSNLKKYLARVEFVHKNFSELGLIVRSWEVERIDGILFDLGVSTYQLTSPERGFSFNIAAELDMRMNPHHQRLKAKEIVNHWD